MNLGFISGCPFAMNNAMSMLCTCINLCSILCSGTASCSIIENLPAGVLLCAHLATKGNV